MSAYWCPCNWAGLPAKCKMPYKFSHVATFRVESELSILIIVRVDLQYERTLPQGKAWHRVQSLNQNFVMLQDSANARNRLDMTLQQWTLHAFRMPIVISNMLYDMQFSSFILDMLNQKRHGIHTTRTEQIWQMKQCLLPVTSDSLIKVNSTVCR